MESQTKEENYWDRIHYEYIEEIFDKQWHSRSQIFKYINKIQNIDKSINGKPSVIEYLKSKLPLDKNDESYNFIKVTIEAAEDRQNAVKEVTEINEDSINTIDSNGYTPLMRMIKSNYFDLATKLLEKGADPNIVTRHGSAVHMVCHSADNIELLAKYNANFNILNSNQNSPLQTAIEGAVNQKALFSLLNNGATIDQEKALDSAPYYYKNHLARYFEEYNQQQSQKINLKTNTLVSDLDKSSVTTNSPEVKSTSTKTDRSSDRSQEQSNISSQPVSDTVVVSFPSTLTQIGERTSPSHQNHNGRNGQETGASGGAGESYPNLASSFSPGTVASNPTQTPGKGPEHHQSDKGPGEELSIGFQLEIDKNIKRFVHQDDANKASLENPTKSYIDETHTGDGFKYEVKKGNVKDQEDKEYVIKIPMKDASGNRSTEIFEVVVLDKDGNLKEDIKFVNDKDASINKPDEQFKSQLDQEWLEKLRVAQRQAGAKVLAPREPTITNANRTVLSSPTTPRKGNNNRKGGVSK